MGSRIYHPCTDDQTNAIQRIYFSASRQEGKARKGEKNTSHASDRFKYLLTCLQGMVKLKCQRCKHIWNYKGKKKKYVSCGNIDCKTSVTIRKAQING